MAKKQGKKKGLKKPVTFVLDPVTVEMLDELSEAQQCSRSALVGRLLREAVDEQRQMMAAFSNPILREGLVKFLGNRDSLKAMAEVVGQEMSDQQMRLFQDVLGKVATAGEAVERVTVAERKEKKH